MRYFLLLFITSVCNAANAQKATPCGDSIPNWNLEQGNTMWVYTFTDSTRDSAAIAAYVKELETKAGGVNGQVAGCKLDYSWNGWANTPVHLLYPVNFSYKVLIKDMVYKVFIFRISTTTQNNGNRISWDTYPYNRKGCKKWAFHENHFWVFGGCMVRLWAANPDSKSTFDW
jgi:hypothetical protein